MWQGGVGPGRGGGGGTRGGGGSGRAFCFGLRPSSSSSWEVILAEVVEKDAPALPPPPAALAGLASSVAADARIRREVGRERDVAVPLRGCRGRRARREERTRRRGIAVTVGTLSVGTRDLASPREPRTSTPTLDRRARHAIFIASL